MKIGIIGLPQTGKKTMFQILTASVQSEHADINKPVIGTADILDSRFETLVEMYEPKKEARAKIDIALLPKMEKESIARGDIFKDIVDVDAVCHIVRAFEDEAIYHVDGSINPVRDVEMVNAELIIHDLLFIETRLERIEINLKKMKDAKQLQEKILLLKMKEHLEKEKPLRHMTISQEEQLIIRSYPFITLKEMIIVLNIADDNLDNTKLLEKLGPLCCDAGMESMQVSAKVESEISMLDSDQEKKEFMEELGIKEPALGALTRLCLKALGMIPFFTVGKDEVRQWLIRKDSTAPEAAGAIHSDLQRGFIRAEVIKYDELMEFKTETALKNAGKLYVKGKDYVVQDGDILNIRFKV